MHGNVELFAMIFVDCKMVLVPRGHIVSIDTNVPEPHLPCNMGKQSGYATFEEAVPCSKTFCTGMRVSSAQTKELRIDDTKQQTLQMWPSSFTPMWEST
jgi:hypothetical protein